MYNKYSFFSIIFVIFAVQAYCMEKENCPINILSIDNPLHNFKSDFNRVFRLDYNKRAPVKRSLLPELILADSQTDSRGNTFLHIAVLQHDLEKTKYILSNNPSLVLEKNHEGRTAWDLAFIQYVIQPDHKELNSILNLLIYYMLNQS